MRGLALVATAAAVLAAGTATTAAARPPGHVAAMRSYVVLYAKHASFAAAERAIRRAGGRIVRTNRAVGLATGTAPGGGLGREDGAGARLRTEGPRRPLARRRGPEPRHRPRAPEAEALDRARRGRGRRRGGLGGARRGRAAGLAAVGHADDRRDHGRLLRRPAGQP